VDQGRLRKFECIFVHRAGFTRRISVYAIDEATAERMAWHALVGTRAWRHTWIAKSVLVDLANETCPECGWPLPPELPRCTGCNYPDRIPVELSGEQSTLTQEDAR